MDKPLTKIAYDRAAMVCQDIDLEQLSRSFLTPDLPPGDFLRILLSENRLTDAVKFLARALPKREATWWACLAARSALADITRKEEIAALESAETWVYRPSEDNRRLAYARAQSAGFDNPSSWAAMAAFWSGGSMTPPDVPVVPPADHLTAKAVAGAVMLAAVQTDPAMANANYQRFIQQGMDIAGGGNGQKPDEARDNG